MITPEEYEAKKAELLGRLWHSTRGRRPVPYAGPRPPNEARVGRPIVLNVVMIAIFLGIAFPVHEFAHAWVAYLRGDATAKLFGRLTLNPIVHFDPVGGVMTDRVACSSAAFLFGWAKPTPVNTDRTSATAATTRCWSRWPVRSRTCVMAILGAIVIRLARSRLGRRRCRGSLAQTS